MMNGALWQQYGNMNIDQIQDEYQSQKDYLESLQRKQDHIKDKQMLQLLGQRDFMLAKNADLEGDVRTLQQRSRGKRTSTIEMALSPEEKKNVTTNDLSVETDSVELLNKYNYHRPQNVKLNQKMKSSVRRQQQASKKSSDGRSHSSPNQRGRSQERLKIKQGQTISSKGAQSHYYQQAIQRDIQSPDQFMRVQQNDSKLVSIKSNKMPIGSGTSDDLKMGDQKTMILWQDFQKMLANQMLGEKMSSHTQSRGYSPQRYGMKSIKQSPLRTNFYSYGQQRSQNDKQTFQSKNSTSHGPDSSEPQTIEGIDNNLSLFQQGIQDAIISHHNKQQFKKSKSKKNRQSPKKSRSQRRQKRQQTDQQQRIAYKATLKDLVKDEQANQYQVDPATFYNLQFDPQFEHPETGQSLQQQQFSDGHEMYYETQQQRPETGYVHTNASNRVSIKSSQDLNFEKKNSSNGNSSNFPLRQSVDFRKATATFPDKSSIEEYVYDSKLGSNDVGGRDHMNYKRISISKLADIENQMQIQKESTKSSGKTKENALKYLKMPNVYMPDADEDMNGQSQSSAQNSLCTPPLIASDPNIAIVPQMDNQFKPETFANTKLQSRHSQQAQNIDGLATRTLPVDQVTRNMDPQHRFELELQPIQRNKLSSSGSGENPDYLRQKIKKINLPSYRDDRIDRPTHFVRDSGDMSQSSKTNTMSGTKRMTDTLQQRSEDLHAIPSVREEDQSLELQPQIPSQVMDGSNQYIQNIPTDSKTMKFKKQKKRINDGNILLNSDSRIGFGLIDGNQEENMFNVEQFTGQDDSSMYLMNQQSKKKVRKTSPEELIDTVNRKYGLIFGQNQPLVGLGTDLRHMDTEDFMKYLTQNDKSRSQIRKANSQMEMSPEHQVNVMGSQSQINLQINQQPPYDQLNQFIDKSLKQRFRSQPRKPSSVSRRNLKKSGSRSRVHAMLNNKFKQGRYKKVQFQDVTGRFNPNKAASVKSLKQLKSLYRNHSEFRTADDSMRFKGPGKRNYVSWRSLSRLPQSRQSQKAQHQWNNYGRAITCLTPSISRKGNQFPRNSHTSLQRSRKLDMSKSFIENDWDREEISRQKYQEYLNEKNRLKQRKDPWMPREKPQVQGGGGLRKSTSQRNLSEEKTHLDDQYKKVVLDIWKEVKAQNKQQILANKKPDRFDGETQVSIQKKATNQMARIRAIQNKLKPYVFQRFSDFYQINKKMDTGIEIQKRIQALTLNEQILHKIDFDLLQTDIEIIRLRLLNAYMLLKTYQQAGDDLRVIRFMQESTDKNLYLPSLLRKLSQTGDLGELDLQNYVLFIYQLYAESLLRKSHNLEAKSVFYDVCKIYNRWKINNRTLQEISDLDPANMRIFEFGIDDYIKAKASYAESIMNCGEIDHAIDKFENTKKTIENEIIYENPMIYVNVCNQLANCYLQRHDTGKALKNFEISLSMISKIEAEKQVEAGTQGKQSQIDRVSPLVVAKICLNIAIIRSQMGQHDEAVFMHEKSLLYKSQVLPQLHDEIRDQNILLAFAQQRANMPDKACASLHRALQIHKSHNSSTNYKAAQLYSQLANGYLKCNQIQEAIQNYEHSCMILLKIEQAKVAKQDPLLPKPNVQVNNSANDSHLNDVKNTTKDEDRSTNKLDKTYLQLLDLYLKTGQTQQVSQVMQTLEIRLESISNTDEYAYRMMNELANLLQRHEIHDKSIIYYKKALLCMKRRHKNRFNQQPETAKILINIASVLYATDNVNESLKSFMHALEVLGKVTMTFQQFEGDITPFKQLYTDTLIEKGKVHMTCANILKLVGNGPQAALHYNKAIDNFNQVCQLIADTDFAVPLSRASEVELKNIKFLMLEARQCLRELEK